MKYFIVISLVLGVTCAFTSESDVTNLIQKIKDLKESSASPEEKRASAISEFKIALRSITKEVGEKLCNSTGTELYEATIKSLECVHNEDTDGLVCDSYQATFKKCIGPVEKVFEGCVKAKYHDIPQLIVNVVTSISEHLCNSRVRDVAELVNPCSVKSVDTIKICFDKVKTVFDGLDKIVNLKTELCRTLKSAKTCALDEIKKSCKNEVTRKSFETLYDALIVKPCSLN